ncbi:MAG: hypothetical protein U9N81_08770 [Bacillota bacterium]|nr:hypothetical protein [Bacillota bacterium]
MLLEHLTNYCDEKYQEQCARGKCSIDECTHDHGSCPQPGENKCELCLREVHYHHPNGRKDYTCDKIVNYYVCRYAHKYASEIAYSFDVLDCLSTYDKFNILSIGCGPAPDLMAFEKYNMEHNSVPITYIGFDVNPRWKPIHQEIVNYCGSTGMKAQFVPEDAVEYFRTNKVFKANVLVLEYVVSHFICTEQFDQLDQFFSDVAEHIVAFMEKDAVIIIQDTNHYKLGRDDFVRLVRSIWARGQKFKRYKRYFDFNINNNEQKYRKPYPSTVLKYRPSRHLQETYCSPRDCCGGVQLLLELEVKK